MPVFFHTNQGVKPPSLFIDLGAELKLEGYQTVVVSHDRRIGGIMYDPSILRLVRVEDPFDIWAAAERVYSPNIHLQRFLATYNDQVPAEWNEEKAFVVFAGTELKSWHDQGHYYPALVCANSGWHPTIACRGSVYGRTSPTYIAAFNLPWEVAGVQAEVQVAA
jgi:hypothetical protein